MEQLVAEKALDEDCKLCPKFTRTFMILGKKWNGLIIEVLLKNGNMRFKDIASSIAKCSDRVLCERLKLEGYNQSEISRILSINNKRVSYVCKKMRKLLLSYID